MTEQLEAELRALRLLVGRVLERMETPRVLRYERAAALLDISPRKLADLVVDGTVVPVRIGGRKKIPLSEIERLTTPRQAPAMPKVAHGRKKHDGAKESTRALDLARASRRRRP